ncbi:hypothetical protein ABZ897_40865 [Nonomuraea sp. NPDC046802]
MSFSSRPWPPPVPDAAAVAWRAMAKRAGSKITEFPGARTPTP